MSAKAPSTVETSLAGHVATVLCRRPPHNFLDVPTLWAVADAVARLDEDENCRAVVIASEGRSFSAGADFGAVAATGEMVDSAALYAEAMRLFRNRKPLVAAVHGHAIGAGAGLALACDFRITCSEARFGFDFNRLGIHPGFGLSLTLPRLIGAQRAARLFYTGRRIGGEEALAIGLVPREEVRARAAALAAEIAASAPMAVQATRETLRQGLAEEVAACNARELRVQRPQFASRDFVEGVTAAAERRPPVFTGR